MATNFNKVLLMGNLTRDPELRYIPSGTAVCTLGLAVNRKYKQNDEMKEETCFVDVVVWGKRAENCSEYLTKGRPIFVEGRLNYRSWEGDDGKKRNKLDVVALDVQFLGTPGKGAPQGKQEEEMGGEDVPPITNEGLPF
ncbi:MAG: single-stranded DNA-binding protein [bacterium]